MNDRLNWAAGLPDFFGQNTKMGKYTKLAQTIPNGHKMYQNCRKID
jgi:hypothetical protein